MKRIMLLILMMCLVLSLPLCAFAQTDDLCGLPLAEDAWYELSEDASVLTVRLPMEDAQNESWRFMIGNESVIELLTGETLGDEEGEQENAQWVGSFRSFASGGSTVIQFTHAAQDGEILETRLIDLTAAEDAALTINDAVCDSFYSISEDGAALSISLDANPSTGFSWSYSLSDAEVLLCAKEEYVQKEGTENIVGAGGTWTAEFSASFKKAGFVTLTLNYARPWESVQPAQSHVISLFVNEAGLLEPVSRVVREQMTRRTISAGKYKRPWDGSSLLLTKRADGTYSAEISIYRLTLQDDCTGILEDGVLTLVATDAAGGNMTWTITPEGDALKAVVTESAWSLLPEGETFLFEPEMSE